MNTSNFGVANELRRSVAVIENAVSGMDGWRIGLDCQHVKQGTLNSFR